MGGKLMGKKKEDLTELVGRCLMKEELLTDLVMKLGKEIIIQNY